LGVSEVSRLEQLLDLIPLAFSIVLISSMVLLPFTCFSMQEVRRGHEMAADGSSLFVAVRLSQPNGIQRWIVRIAQRKEAPDEEDHGPSQL
jgi:hypothetical protein